MEKIKKLKVKVVAFPVDKYDRLDARLDRKTDDELLAIAEGDPDCAIWDGLEVFQTYLNDDLVDVDNNWIFFCHVK